MMALFRIIVKASRSFFMELCLGLGFKLGKYKSVSVFKTMLVKTLDFLVVQRWFPIFLREFPFHFSSFEITRGGYRQTKLFTKINNTKRKFFLNQNWIDVSDSIFVTHSGRRAYPFSKFVFTILLLLSFNAFSQQTAVFFEPER